MKPFVMCLIGAALLMTSCVSYQLLPQETDGNRIGYNRGAKILYANDERLTIATSAQVYKSLIYFSIVVKNLTDQNIHVEDRQTTLFEENEAGLSSNIKVYKADEFYNKRRTEILTGQILMAVSAALSTINAGRSTSYTNGTYSIYGQSRTNYYHGFGTYNSTTTTYNAAAAAMERDIAFSNVRDYVNGTNNELDYLKNTLFYPSDIPPNGEYFGIIVAELGEEISARMTLDVAFDSSHFKFEFNKDQTGYGE
jgi:hypothetical protein